MLRREQTQYGLLLLCIEVGLISNALKGVIIPDLAEELIGMAASIKCVLDDRGWAWDKLKWISCRPA